MVDAEVSRPSSCGSQCFLSQPPGTGMKRKQRSVPGEAEALHAGRRLLGKNRVMEPTEPPPEPAPSPAAGARDRDAAGRPRNARPRDGLGRPLPKGMAGVPTTPDVLILPPAEALREAQRLLDGGRPFHAHEVLEGAWKASAAPEREFWRGMAQLAVGLTHARRGNSAGAARLLQRAADRIEA